MEGRVLTCTTQRRIHVVGQRTHILSDFLRCAGCMCKWSCIVIPRGHSVLAHNFARLGNNIGPYDLRLMEENPLPHFDEQMHWLTYQKREPDEKEGRNVAVTCVFDPKWGIGNFKLYPLLQCYLNELMFPITKVLTRTVGLLRINADPTKLEHHGTERSALKTRLREKLWSPWKVKTMCHEWAKKTGTEAIGSIFPSEQRHQLTLRKTPQTFRGGGGVWGGSKRH